MRQSKGFNNIHFHKTISVTWKKVNKKEVVVQLRVDERHKNFHGLVHGGALATLLDAATGLSVFQHLKDDETAVTVSLNIEFFTPASIQGDILARGKFIHRSGRLARAEATIIDYDDKMIAKGYATLMIIPRENEESFSKSIVVKKITDCRE